MAQTIQVEVSDAGAKLLAVLGQSAAIPNGQVTDVLQWLVSCAADGVQRPGSWERQWLLQAFGPFEDALETDPDCEWHDRPRKSLCRGCSKRQPIAMVGALLCEVCMDAGVVLEDERRTTIEHECPCGAKAVYCVACAVRLTEIAEKAAAALDDAATRRPIS